MDKLLLNKGYKEYESTRFDNNSVVSRFQKGFNDEFGKKYSINVLKWSNDCIPIDKRGQWWTPFSYTYEVQISMFKEDKPINLEFFSSWNIEEVEKYMEELFEKMKPNYYESWDEVRRTRPEYKE